MASSPLPFDEDLLTVVADLCARGRSWEETASEVGWNVDELRRAIRREAEYSRVYEAAKTEVREEAEAEMLVVFRMYLRDEDPVEAKRAAQFMEKYLAGQRRDQTRIEVEKLRAATAQAKADAKHTPKAADTEKDEDDCTTFTPKEIFNPEREKRYATGAVNSNATVYLWSGDHPLGGVAPDHTDVPLTIFQDDTIRERTLFWVARVPFHSDIYNGPFPAPHRPPPVPELNEDAVQQMEAFRAAASG